MSLIVEPDQLVEIARTIPWIEGVSQGESEPCCEWWVDHDGRECDEPAVWAARNKCCGAMRLACQGCIEHVVRYLSSFTKPQATCLTCQRVTKGVRTIHDVYRLTRL